MFYWTLRISFMIYILPFPFFCIVISSTSPHILYTSLYNLLLHNLQDVGSSSNLSVLLAQTEATKKQQVAQFENAKNDVVNLLLHYTTTCDITLEESQRQAFLALGRKAYSPDA